MLKPYYQVQKANDIRQMLEEEGLIVPWKITHGGKGFIIGLEITEKGYKSYGLKPKIVFSRGADYTHTFIVENMKRHFEANKAQVRREAMAGSHFADLKVEPGLFVEIAIGNKPSQEAQGILADLEHGEGVLVVGNDKEHLVRIQRALPKDALKHVQLQLFCEFINGNRR
jgi:hypothetical protein